jgi:hypothetical protein
MKFIKVITKHTREDVDNIVSQLSKIHKEILTNLYSNFNHVEYTSEEGFVGMYAVVDEKTIEKLFSEYVKCGIGFSFEDLTKSVLYGKVPAMPREEEDLNLLAIVNEFMEDNLDADVVLDKISESGMESLTERDKKVLITH